MKLIQPFLSLILIAFIISCNSEPEKVAVSTKKKSIVDTSAMASHYDPAHGFEVLYPKDWDTTLADSRAIFTARDTSSADRDGFAENMNVMKTPLNAEPSMKQLSDYVASELKRDYPSAFIRKRIMGETTSGLPYIYVEMALTHSGTDLISTSAYYPQGKDLLMVYMISGTDDYPKHKTLFEQIVQEFAYDK